MDHKQVPLNEQFYNATMRMHRASKKLPPPCKELSHFEFMCLKLIYEYSQNNPELPGIKPSVLSEKTHVSRPAMSQHINALETKGFLQRVASQTDRRVTYLALAEKGREFLKAQDEHLVRHLQTICNLLGPEDTAELIRLTDKLSDIYLQIAEQEQTVNAGKEGGVC